MRRNRKPHYGDGTAWLVADRARGDFSCGWYVGPSGDRLADHGRAGTAMEAVEWGRVRTTRVRIRTVDACSYWAGTAPRPDGFTHTWSEDSETEVLGQPATGILEESNRPGSDVLKLDWRTL